MVAQRQAPWVSKQTDLRLAALLLTTTGFAALGHQVLWTRRMIDLLGASTQSTVRVFVCLFLGLALGAACAASLVTGIKRPWRVLAGIELGVGLSCVPIITLPFWTGWLWPALGPDKLVSGLGSLVKTGLSVLLLLSPAFLMGMTLPVIVSAVCVAGVGLRREAVRLYALNTLGGVLGLTVAAGFAIRYLGIPGSMVLFMGVNLFVAVRCHRRSRLEPQAQVVAEATASKANVDGGGGAAFAWRWLLPHSLGWASWPSKCSHSSF